MRQPIRYMLALAVLVGMGAACSNHPAASPTGVLADAKASWLESTNATLIQCPAPAAPATSSALIGPAGGVISAGGVSVIIPADAVLGDPVTFTLSVPASNYVELEVTPAGSDHYTFARTITVSVDYGRCGSAYDASLLSAWNIDPITKQLLQPMVSVDNKLTHTVTFVTDHFSGYAVAD